MIFCQNSGILIIWIRCKVVVEINVHQIKNLVTMPMHALNFHFKLQKNCSQQNQAQTPLCW